MEFLLGCLAAMVAGFVTMKIVEVLDNKRRAKAERIADAWALRLTDELDSIIKQLEHNQKSNAKHKATNAGRNKQSIRPKK